MPQERVQKPKHRSRESSSHEDEDRLRDAQEHTIGEAVARRTQLDDEADRTTEGIDAELSANADIMAALKRHNQ